MNGFYSTKYVKTLLIAFCRSQLFNSFEVETCSTVDQSSQDIRVDPGSSFRVNTNCSMVTNLNPVAPYNLYTGNI